nr:MAG TPA: hypothetical protein [Caudoviricetes sp.]
MSFNEANLGALSVKKKKLSDVQTVMYKQNTGMSKP